MKKELHEYLSINFHTQENQRLKLLGGAEHK